MLTYNINKTIIPNLKNDIHKSHPKGFAYETDTHFVHFYGQATEMWDISTELTVTEKKESTLSDWVAITFGANNIQNLNSNIGETTNKVWRPGLLGFSETNQGLNIDKKEQRDSMQSLRMLLNKLDDILLYIEPYGNGLNAFSHKTRELLILACTEVENSWTMYLKETSTKPSGRNYNTNDYVKLQKALHLGEYKIRVKIKSGIQYIIPFENWNILKPTDSLSWYYSYNKTKHDRTYHFDKATLENCLKAVAANIAMFSARYSPYILWRGSNSTSSIFNQLFDIELIKPDPKTFYLPKINLSKSHSVKLNCFDSTSLIQKSTVKKLVI